MSGVDKATGRVVTLVVLLVVAVVALRGYVPGSERAPRAHTLGDTAAFIVIVALLGVSVTVVVIAVGARVPGAQSACGDGPHRGPGGLVSSRRGRATEIQAAEMAPVADRAWADCGVRARVLIARRVADTAGWAARYRSALTATAV